MSTSEFFEDNKIARARRGSAICCWKLKNFFFYKRSLCQIARETRVTKVNEKQRWKSRRNFENVRALFLICTPVTTLHSVLYENALVVQVVLNRVCKKKINQKSYLPSNSLKTSQTRMNQITSLENGNRRPLATHNHLLWSSL